MDRQLLISLQVEKSHRILAEADEMVNLQHWDIAANRYYYACFHAVQALFIHNGLTSKRHSGMISQLGLHFIKPGIIEE